MRKTIKKVASLLLVLVQLIALLPTLIPVTEAAQADSEIPILNKTIVGTVQFQSFNFLGDNSTGEDGTDYSTTFYYSDDYFSPSAINESANSQTMLWTDIDNMPLATCSIDFAVASMTSAEGDVLTATSQTWKNSSYSAAIKEKNVRDFLSTCGFSSVECMELDKRPRNDSIGYTLGSKEITVWNAETEKNETYTLIAVGVRGAGYGQEWASNISIGDPATGAIPSNGRHYGFDHSAQIVCDGIRNYLSNHSITGNVKYWVTGFSRAAAVANLVSGYLTDDRGTYLAAKKDIYGYTWECPQAASTRENALNYKNIHNILNPMDAVPKVSPDAFEHQRLGVDYQMPYHNNVTSTSQNTTLYKQMFEVLKTVATGSKYTGKADPLVDDTTTSAANDGFVSPNKYPLNNPITIYRVDGGELINQVLDYAIASDKQNAKLLKEFGAVQAVQKHEERYGPFNAFTRTVGNADELLGWGGGTNYSASTWYLDDFIDGLVNVFLTSDAWVGGVGTGRTAMQNRATFIQNYQPHFRTLFGYFLDYAGPAFLGLVPSLVDAVADNIGETVFSPFPAAFLAFYAAPTNSLLRNAAINSAKPIAQNVIDSMTDGFTDPEYQGITKQQAKDAMDQLVPLVFNLYAYELDRFDSQFFGTTLRYLNTILCTHEQETVLSWIMSLDPNHMNRSCRTITVPAGCDATLYEYRPEFEGVLDDDPATTAPVVAEVKNGALVAETLKDQRIYCTTSSGNTIIRYPASLQIRADITSDNDFEASSVRVADYRTTNAFSNVSKGESQFKTTTLDSSNGYSSVTNTSATNVTSTNTALNNYGMISAGDTLHILADDIATYNGNNPDTYSLAVDKVSVPTIVSYTKAGSNLNQGTDASVAVRLGMDTTVEMTEDNTRSIKTRKKTIVVPASNVYYDDELATVNSQSTYIGDTTRLDRDDEGTILWYQFRGTRIDLYCTTDSTTGYVMAAVYENNDGELGDRIGIKTIKSSSETIRYNVPTISFDVLDASKDYFLRLYAIKGANYRLDGIRVYHGADENDTDVKAAYEAVGEQDAKYVNLRGLLLNNISEETLQDDNEAGALFYTDSGTSYALTSDEYRTNSPKNEIYLQPGQSVAFQIIGSYEKVAVGLSAPESKTDGGTVTVSDGSGRKTLSVANALDQYYVITPTPNGSVLIQNSGDSMLAITNVKLSGKYTPPEDAAMRVSAPLMVTRSLLRYASNFAELPGTEEEPEEVTVDEEETPPVVNPPAEQTPEPEPSSPAAPSNETLSLSKMLYKLVQRVRSLFGF